MPIKNRHGDRHPAKKSGPHVAPGSQHTAFVGAVSVEKSTTACPEIGQASSAVSRSVAVTGYAPHRHRLVASIILSLLLAGAGYAAARLVSFSITHLAALPWSPRVVVAVAMIVFLGCVLIVVGRRAS